MTALAFWKAVVEDHSDVLEGVIGLLEEHGIRYCVIGGVGVNAYAEPVVTLDLDIVIAGDDLEHARELLGGHFRLRDFAHRTNVYDPGSKLQVRIQRDPGLAPLVDRAEVRNVMDLRVPVAAADDLVRAKAIAAQDPTRRASKRGKDILDLARLVSVFPDLAELVPDQLRERVTEFVDREDA